MQALYLDVIFHINPLHIREYIGGLYQIYDRSLLFIFHFCNEDWGIIIIEEIISGAKKIWNQGKREGWLTHFRLPIKQYITIPQSGNFGCSISVATLKYPFLQA